MTLDPRIADAIEEVARILQDLARVFDNLVTELIAEDERGE